MRITRKMMRKSSHQSGRQHWAESGKKLNSFGFWVMAFPWRLQSVNKYGQTLLKKLLLHRNFFQSPTQRLVNLFSVILLKCIFRFLNHRKMKTVNFKESIKRCNKLTVCCLWRKSSKWSQKVDAPPLSKACWNLRIFLTQRLSQEEALTRKEGSSVPGEMRESGHEQEKQGRTCRE